MSGRAILLHLFLARRRGRAILLHLSFRDGLVEQKWRRIGFKEKEEGLLYRSPSKGMTKKNCSTRPSHTGKMKKHCFTRHQLHENWRKNVSLDPLERENEEELLYNASSRGEMKHWFTRGPGSISVRWRSPKQFCSWEGCKHVRKWNKWKKIRLTDPEIFSRGVLEY